MPLMLRRNFIALLGGAAAALPLATSAQQLEHVRLIGMLLPTNANEFSNTPISSMPLCRVLAQAGWIAGRNLRVETRWAGGDVEGILKKGR